MIIEIIKIITSLIIFSLPGIFLSYRLFPKCNIAERIAYTLVISFSVKAILNFLISFVGINSAITCILWMLITGVFVYFLFKKWGFYQTIFDRDSLYIFLLSFVGLGLKLWFYLPMEKFGECYGYASKFTRGMVPDLGFYTGMALDHSYYILKQSNGFLSFITPNIYPGMFLSVFIYLSFIYILFKQYNKNNIIMWAVAIFATVPIEFFKRVTIDQAILSFIFTVCLFISFKTKDKNFLKLLFIMCPAICFTSYSATITILALCAGFIMALAVKIAFQNKNFIKTIKEVTKDKKLWTYIGLFAISLVSLLMLSKMFLFTTERILDTSFVKYAFNNGLIKETISMNDNPLEIDREVGSDILNNPEITKEFSLQNTVNSYQSPRYFGLSVMGWQSLFFLLCGLSFVLYVSRSIFRKKVLIEDDKDILYCIIPAALLGLLFAYVNYPARIFVYLSFFSILSIKISNKWVRPFFFISFFLLLLSTTIIIQEQRMFSNQPNGEISAATEIKNTLNGIIFSDQCFVNQLVLHDYYQVTGTNDKNPILNSLFYTPNRDDFLKAINKINSSDIPYIAITKRMEEKFILMVDFQIKPIYNEKLWEENLEKVYDNGYVRVFSTKINQK